MPGPKAKPIADRFWKFVDKNGPVLREELGACWLWLGTCLRPNHLKGKLGYGMMGIGSRVDGSRRKMQASRVAWALERGGEFPQESVLHRCDNPRCVRASHLFLGSHTDNMRDMRSKGRGALGDRHGRRKLTAKDVASIRAARSSRRALAEQFGVSVSQIARIITRENW